MCECTFEIVRKDAKDAVFYESEWMHKEVEMVETPFNEIPFLLEKYDVAVDRERRV